MTNKWRKIANFYKESYNVDELTLNLIIDFDVLSLCVKGLSNKDIASLLEITEEEVKQTLLHYFGFGGFVETLDFNIYHLYKENILGEVNLIKLCDKYEEYKKKVEKYENS